MQLPIRNNLAEPLTLFVEPLYFKYEIPRGGVAVVTLEEGRPHSLDYHGERWLSLWGEGISSPASVQVLSAEECG